MTAPEDGGELFVVGDEEAGSRLDLFLARRLPALSRSRIQQLIRDGLVTAGAPHVKPGLVVWAGLQVRVIVPPPAAPTIEPEPLPLTLLYEDASLAVIDKPAGMVVHPAAGHPRGTLVNALLHQVRGLSGIGGSARPGIVHRLDRGTSGVMVVAKTDAAHRDLARQFHDRRVRKEYVALAWGAVRSGQTIERPIGRDPRDRTKMSSRGRRARAATTTIERAETRHGVSLVHLTIGSGRTHQIRVHLSEIGHPIVGDVLYGGVRQRFPAALAALRGVSRPLLHAARIAFTHPSTGRPVAFAAPLPADLSDILERLGWKAVDTSGDLAI